MSDQQNPLQTQPRIEEKINPKPVSVDRSCLGSKKLESKVALITGGDSGIGRAIALAFAKEGADISIVYCKARSLLHLNEHIDATRTEEMVEEFGRKCITISGDIEQEKFCIEAIEKTTKGLGKLDILVNNAAWQQECGSIENITKDKLKRAFKTNIFSFLYMIKAAIKYMKKGSVIINTTSVGSYKGSLHLLDYSSTKEAIVSFTSSLSKQLVEKGIRVNGVAPGPVAIPLISSSFSEEVSPSYVFLASDDASYMTGQIVYLD